MNRFLRTAPTRQLLTVIGGLVALIVAGAAIAIAAQGRGPVPRAQPLARAIHQALAAKPLTAISARISFTNNLLDSAEIQGADPLLSGGSGRLWYSAGHGLRVELQGDNGDANLVVWDRSFWAYDPASNTLYEGRLPAARTHQKAHHERLPTVAQIQADLGRAMAHLRISPAIPGDVAGRPTYTVRVSPRASGGLIGAAELAWDAIRGVPLRFAVYAKGDRTPVLTLTVTSVSYQRVSASVFTISPPSGAKIVNLSLPSRARKQLPAGLPFKVVAPTTVAGLRRTSITRLGGRGVVIVYGRYLGGIAVIEQLARPNATRLAGPSSGDQPGLNLPSVSINGTSGQELDTALGTVVRFARGGVEYTVIGSVAPAVARAAARSL